MVSTDEGLIFEGMLPVSFQPVDNFPEEDQLAIINEGNEYFLKTSLILHESIEIDEHNEVSLELRRQDLKINLLLNMLGELLVQQKSLPPATMLKLTAKGLECVSIPVANNAEVKVEIDLYITPSIPKALKLYGEVSASEDGSRTTIRFVGVNQAVQDGLEKIIFRHHRRTVAQGIALK